MNTKEQAIKDAFDAILQARLPQSTDDDEGQAQEQDPRLKTPKSNQQHSNQKSSKSSSNQEDNQEENNTTASTGSESKSNTSPNKDEKIQPQIGDTGNKEIQDAEEAQREATIQKEKAEELAKKAKYAGDDETAEKASDLLDDAKSVSKEAKDLKKDIDSGKVGDEEEKKRLQRIKDALSDLKNKEKALDEIDTAVFASNQLEADKKRRKEYQDNPAARFIDSVNQFIKNQTAYLRAPSWKRFSKRYIDSNPLIQKGKARTRNEKIPLINVYFDRSRSWDDSKIKVGIQAVAGLNRYVRKGQLKINIYYFADDVHSNPEDAEKEGGTRATQRILDHIKQTHADNVIIMTDDDMETQGKFSTSVKVDGAVWFVFVGGVCKEIMKYLSGRELTKAYELK
jgi:hypothetical protein